MGSLVKCRACGYRCGERPIGVYWRWMRADGIWKAYYARICAACYASKVLPLDQDYPPDAQLTCPQCGIGTEDDYDAIYTTSYPGGGGKVGTDSPFCGVHAAEYRVWVQSFAQDTESLSGAAQPQRESTTAGRSSNSSGLRVA